MRALLEVEGRLFVLVLATGDRYGALSNGGDT